MHVYICIHVYVYTYIYIYTYVCMHFSLSLSLYIYIYIYIYVYTGPLGGREVGLPRPLGHAEDLVLREFINWVLVKGGLAIYVFPLCNWNTLGSAFNVQIENMPNCSTPLYLNPPL